MRVRRNPVQLRPLLSPVLARETQQFGVLNPLLIPWEIRLALALVRGRSHLVLLPQCVERLMNARPILEPHRGLARVVPPPGVPGSLIQLIYPPTPHSSILHLTRPNWHLLDLEMAEYRQARLGRHVMLHLWMTSIVGGMCGDGGKQIQLSPGGAWEVMAAIASVNQAGRPLALISVFLFL